MAIKNNALTTSAANIYVSSGNTVITTIHLCNYSASPVTANVYLVPSGNVAGFTNIIYANVSITAYNTLIIYQEKFCLNNGDMVQANCSTGSAVTSTISYVGF
jgi:hypothetical protein